ncbi:MAG: PAS domain-containing sensor histidine kinase, partial [Rhizobiales bacterium]|nr:PAS domain-containing sensor histidine kinase [Hyphomicrobiales bacterium]
MASIASAEQTTSVDVAAPATNRTARILGPIAAGLAMLSAFATFVVLADLTPLTPTQNVVVTLLLINALTVFLLLGVIASEVWMVVQARRRGRAAARLHVRIVALFAVVAAVPTILVAVVASVTLDRGLDRLFSTRTKAIIENSLIVADAYLQEQARMIRGDIMAMSFDVSRAKPLFDSDKERFKQFFSAQARIRGLSSATILGADGSTIEQADIGPQQSVPLPETSALTNVTESEPQIAMLLPANSVAAVVKLHGYDNQYLSAARMLDPRVVSQLRETQATVRDFANLQSRRFGVQLAFALMYTVIALAVLLSAAWLGLSFANQLVAPIRRLIGAANIVSTGNLYIQVPV